MQATLAARTLVDTKNPDKVVTVLIDIPVPEGNDWACAYRIEGMDIDDRVYGVDALQALLLAVECIRQKLLENGPGLTWSVDGQPVGDHGDPGIPKQVPTLVDFREQMRISQMIDDAVSEWVANRANEKRSRGRDDS